MLEHKHFVLEHKLNRARAPTFCARVQSLCSGNKIFVLKHEISCSSTNFSCSSRNTNFRPLRYTILYLCRDRTTIDRILPVVPRVRNTNGTVFHSHSAMWHANWSPGGAHVMTNRRHLVVKFMFLVYFGSTRRFPWVTLRPEISEDCRVSRQVSILEPITHE